MKNGGKRKTKRPASTLRTAPGHQDSQQVASPDTPDSPAGQVEDMPTETVASAPRSATIPVPRHALAAFGLLNLAPWLVVLAIGTTGLYRSCSGRSLALSSASAPMPDGFTRGKTGPWGQIEYQDLSIDPTESSISPRECEPQPVQWFFANRSEEDLERTIDALGLPEDLRREFLDKRRWRSAGNRGTMVAPRDQLILDLPSDARTKVYRVLSESPTNRWHISPFTFHRHSMQEWRTDGSLAPATVDLLEQLTYGATGDLVFFSDKDLLLSRIPVPERLRALKVLRRRLIIAARLRIPPKANVERLASYWCKGNGVKSIVPILRELANEPAGGTIDLVHLLTPFARMHLNTFPEGGETGFLPDCFWTSANFFNDDADAGFSSVDAFIRHVERDYFPVDADPTYGDMILLTDNNGSLFLSANYIADDIVYIKTRASASIPWMLTSLSDLTTIANHFRPTHKLIYRKRHL